MRLLHTTSLQLIEFIEDIPRAQYAILSHTWGNDEVSFRDLTHDITRSKRGWRKITSACEYAASRGWEYIWIDTCCIDKSDPTELSLAINSMFRWYEASGVCYAYLADVLSPSSRPRVAWFQKDDFGVFSQSRWFRRGWTLQELLAPDVLEFLYEDWTPIASREDMAPEIHKATGITSDHLANFRMCCLATKLSWAANRETTRVEDRSYSLLGLLGVHMPLIYGEGENAFVRLQHELIRKYNDESIFVWDGNIETPKTEADEPLSPTTLGIRSKVPQDNSNASFPAPLTRPVVELEVDPSTHTSILAPSLRNFMSATQFDLQTYRHDKTRFRFEMTNSGLSINAELYRNVQFFAFPAYMISLNCSYVHQKVKPGFPRRVSSPMVLLLSEAYPDESEMHDYVDRLNTNYGPQIPTMFRKIQHGPMDWQELDPGRTQWVSLGRHNIIILNEHEVEESGGGVTSLDYFGDVKFVFDPPAVNQSLIYSIIGYRRLFWDTKKLKWAVLLLTKLGAQEEEEKFFTLTTSFAWVFEIAVLSDRQDQRGSYIVLVQCGLRRTLACGIWPGAFGTNGDVEIMLNSQHDPTRGYPYRAPFPNSKERSHIQVVALAEYQPDVPHRLFRIVIR